MARSICRILTGSLFAFCFAGATIAWAGGTHGARSQSVSFGEPGKASDVTRTVQVTARDMTYHMEPLQVLPGETIRFVVKNVDEVDHDFTIGPEAMQAEHRKSMTAMMESGQNMSKMHREKNAVFVQPGETAELVWKFNTVLGIEFACNVPGHYESGMKGEFAIDGQSLSLN